MPKKKKVFKLPTGYISPKYFGVNEVNEAFNDFYDFIISRNDRYEEYETFLIEKIAFWLPDWKTPLSVFYDKSREMGYYPNTDYTGNRKMSIFAEMEHVLKLYENAVLKIELKKKAENRLKMDKQALKAEMKLTKKQLKLAK